MTAKSPWTFIGNVKWYHETNLINSKAVKCIEDDKTGSKKCAMKADPGLYDFQDKSERD